MNKQNQDENLSDIRKAIEAKKAFLGTKQTLKALRDNTAGKIYMTSNTPEEVRQTVTYYSKLNNVDCQQLEQTNEELGMACRKPFLISVVAVAR